MNSEFRVGARQLALLVVVDFLEGTLFVVALKYERAKEQAPVWWGPPPIFLRIRKTEGTVLRQATGRREL